jgi:hypothetical protein
VFAKISSSSATLLTEILPVSILHSTAMNFQFTLHEIKPNKKKIGHLQQISASSGIFLGDKIRF